VFVSSSTREEHIAVFLDCLEQVVAETYDIRKTPELLESAQSQLEQIIETIKGCVLGVVVLDGLRPNVVFEYGVLIGVGRPTILFLEKEATVDLRGLHSVEPPDAVRNIPLNIDMQFSDIKDQFIARWNRYDPKGTRQAIKEQLEKKGIDTQHRGV